MVNIRYAMDQFGNPLSVGDFVTYPFRRYGSAGYETNVAKIVNITQSRHGSMILRTQIVTRNREWYGNHELPEYKLTRSKLCSHGWSACKIPAEYLRHTKYEMLLNDDQ